MSRRRAGVKFQIRRAIAQHCLKPGQERSNNKPILQTFFNKFLADKPTVGEAVIEVVNRLPKVQIISNISIKQTIYIIDPKTSYPLARLVGTTRNVLIEELQRDDLSEASTVSRPPSPDDIEIIELD